MPIGRGYMSAEDVPSFGRRGRSFWEDDSDDEYEPLHSSFNVSARCEFEMSESSSDEDGGSRDGNHDNHDNHRSPEPRAHSPAYNLNGSNHQRQQEIVYDDLVVDIHPSSPVSTSASSSSSVSSINSLNGAAADAVRMPSAPDTVTGTPQPRRATRTGITFATRSWSSDDAQSNDIHEGSLPTRNTLIFTAKNQRSTFSLLVFGFCLFGFALYSSSRSNMSTALVRISNLTALKKRTRDQISIMANDVKRLNRQITALHLMHQRQEDAVVEKTIRDMASAYTHTHKKGPTVMREMKSMQSKLKAASARAEALKLQVQANSREETVRKFGAGAKRVQLELVFPGSNIKGPTIIVMEMASLELMPHSVHTFLEMTSLGLLDGCSFIMNALHVLKAAPLPHDNSPAHDKVQEFAEHGLESVAFQEYSTFFPHRKYTVGFAADGSPSFFINTKDNSDVHAGDPCFAKVVSGFDTIKRMEKMPTRNGIWFERRIGIKKAMVL